MSISTVRIMTGLVLIIHGVGHAMAFLTGFWALANRKAESKHKTPGGRGLADDGSREGRAPRRSRPWEIRIEWRSASRSSSWVRRWASATA